MSLAAVQVELPCEEQQRADIYGLLSALLLGPEAQLVDALGNAEAGDDDSALGGAWQELVQGAQRGAGAVLAEYDALFVAAGTPRINPYQCYYLAGWLMDKPLALLRQDLRELGLSRLEGATELEDHIGSLCEAMRVLIQRGAAHATQQDFFARHLANWTDRCLRDLAGAAGDGFYAALSRFIQAFFRLEAQVLGVEVAASPMHPPRTARHVEAAA
jgi:TorA maturation chaperone TorD